MLLILKRGTDLRILRGIVRFDSRIVPWLGPAILIWYKRGGGTAFSENYLATYDEAIVIGEYDVRTGAKLRWVVLPGEPVFPHLKTEWTEMEELSDG